MIFPQEHFAIQEEFILYDLELVDAPRERAFDNLTELAARLLNVERAMVIFGLASHDALYVKSAACTGAYDCGDCTGARYQLSRSFSREVLAEKGPIAVEDAPRDARVLEDKIDSTDECRAYLGVPLHLPSRSCVGVLCVTATEPRAWSDEDIRLLTQIAQCVDEQISLKQALKETEIAEEKAREAAASRESFLAHMSHEIRTPLNGIIGGVDLLRLNINPGEREELVETIDRSAQNLLRLLNDALDLSKVDAGRMELEEAPFDPCAVAREVHKLFSPNAEAKGIALELKLNGFEPGEMRRGDAFRLQQVLSNLVSNAVKFTDTGRVVLSLTADQAGLGVRVRDSGCGIPPELLLKLFEPYSQAEASVARKKGGTGLGLAIVKSIVSLMGGDISARSTLGKGAEFSFDLPLPRLAAPPPPPARKTHSGATGFRGARVLVADDSGANRMLIRRMLEQLGATVVLAEDGEEAVILASDGGFDMLLLDIQMPGLTGVEVIQALRAADLAAEGLSLGFAVAVTANVFDEQVEGYLAAGFDACLAKPLRLDDLMALGEPLEKRSLTAV
ncbi:ATP-binding protein [Tritonibacter litoralis]|nr:ATP-binding protein [Tritonibacter litoralis]